MTVLRQLDLESFPRRQMQVVVEPEVCSVNACLKAGLAQFEELDVSKALPTYTLLRTQLDGSGRDDLGLLITAAEHSRSNPVAPNGMVPPKKV